MNELQKAQKFHFIGIGGSGMSGLARILVQRGKKVTGSDETATATTLALAHENIAVHIGHKTENLPRDSEVVIYTQAVTNQNPEMIEAHHRGLPQFSYPQAVGQLSEHFETICICGTHGKTTTTAMAAASFMSAGKDPTVIVGASLKELDGRNERLGKGEYFILESCEYRRGFLNYYPAIIVLTNVEADHLDYYKNLEDYKSAYRELIAKLPKNGFVIANQDDENVRDTLAKIPKKSSGAKAIWFGKSSSANYVLLGNVIMHKGYKIAELHLQIPGEHNLMNATATIALANELKLDLSKVIEAIQAYKGASRRFEEKGHVGKTVIIDDYGHHPTEIRATLKAAREKFGKNKKILCIFQPHQYSRTFKLLEGFAQAFADSDEVMIPNILAVRDTEADLKSINVETLVKKLSEHHPKVSHGHGLEKTAETVKKTLSNYDVVITMGAGDVYKIAESLIKDFKH